MNMHFSISLQANAHFLFVVFALLITFAMPYSLQGKHALITGSAGGIGKGIALELVEKGAKVIIHYNVRQKEAQELQEQLGDSCLGILHCDFRRSETIPAFMDRVLELCTDKAADSKDACHLDVLVNNAGVVMKIALEDDDESLTAWHEVLAVNLNAPTLLGKLACTHMKQSGRDGVIINISSIHGEKSNEYMGAYAASKAGLDSVTRTMAIEFAPFGIRVNAVAPGVVPVERTFQVFRDPANRAPWEERLSLGRLGSVEQVAQATSAMIENDWVTGTIWQVDGGMMCRANMPVRPRPQPT